MLFRSLFWQILVNILTNAYEAITGEGEITITSKNEILDEMNYVCLEVKDNGKGISQENLEHVFEPFFTTKTTVGVGLGLSIAYAIMKRWNGDIKIESTLCVGTKIKLYFKPQKETRLIKNSI